MRAQRIVSRWWPEIAWAGTTAGAIAFLYRVVA